MKTILVPTDFSSNAMMALDFAVEKLRDEHTKLALVNVYDIPHGGTSGLFYLLDELKKQAESDMESFCESIEQRYADYDLEVESHIAQGDMSEQVNILANELGADAVVMGSKGSSGVKEVLIGSGTLDMISNLKYPTYVIPENYKKTPLNEIILSYDGSDLSPDTVKEVKNFANAQKLGIKLVHVRIGEDQPIQDWSKIKALFEGLEIDFHESHGENFESGLKKSIDGASALLVMIRHKQSFWERFFKTSDSRKAVMQAKLPMLIIPE